MFAEKLYAEFLSNGDQFVNCPMSFARSGLPWIGWTSWKVASSKAPELSRQKVCLQDELTTEVQFG